jgi:undecaprenyl-diphosphatase
MRHHRDGLPVALIGVGLGGVLAFTLLARRVKAHRTRAIDGRMRKQVPKRRRRVTRIAAQSIEPLGKWWGQMPVAVAVSAIAWRRRGPRAAVPIATASALAASLAWALERVMRPRKPPPGRHSPTEPAFPSGHALQTSAVAWTTAYVLLRERLGPRVGVVPMAVALPVASGLAKLYLDKHWFTDVMGGYVLGATVAAAAAAGYETARPR